MLCISAHDPGSGGKDADGVTGGWRIERFWKAGAQLEDYPVVIRMVNDSFLCFGGRVTNATFSKVTNNNMEMLAILWALVSLRRVKKLKVATDSEVSRNLLRSPEEDYLHPFTPNYALIKSARAWRRWRALRGMTTEIRHVRSHTGRLDRDSIGNDVADRTAAMMARVENGLVGSEFLDAGSPPIPEGMKNTLVLREVGGCLITEALDRRLRKEQDLSRAEQWRSLADLERDEWRKRQGQFARRIVGERLMLASRVVMESLEKLGHRRWKRWLLSWVLCLVGGFPQNLTKRMCEDLGEFVVETEWNAWTCDRRVMEEFPLACVDLLPPRRSHLLQHPPRPPDGSWCAICWELRQMAGKLKRREWPRAVDGYLEADGSHVFDMPGILHHLGGLSQNRWTRASSLLVGVLHHLYPKWKELRVEYWEQWGERDRWDRGREALWDSLGW